MTSLMYFGYNVTFASLPVRLSTIISEMGSITSIQSNGLSAPPYLFCFFVIVGSAFLSDRMHNRGIFVGTPTFIAAISFLIMAITTSTGVYYFALFCCCSLIFVSVAIILAWVTNNSGTDSNHAGGLWILATGAKSGPILGTRVFPAAEGPNYRKGMWIC